MLQKLVNFLVLVLSFVFPFLQAFYKVLLWMLFHTHKKMQYRRQKLMQYLCARILCNAGNRQTIVRVIDWLTTFCFMYMYYFGNFLVIMFPWYKFTIFLSIKPRVVMAITLIQMCFTFLHASETHTSDQKSSLYFSLSPPSLPPLYSCM